MILPCSVVSLSLFTTSNTDFLKINRYKILKNFKYQHFKNKLLKDIKSCCKKIIIIKFRLVEICAY